MLWNYFRASRLNHVLLFHAAAHTTFTEFKVLEISQLLSQRQSKDRVLISDMRFSSVICENCLLFLLCCLTFDRCVNKRVSWVSENVYYADNMFSESRYRTFLEHNIYNVVSSENVSPKVFARLKDIVSSCLPHDRYVVVAFDQCRVEEVAPHLFATKKSACKVQHAYMLVFTIRWITKLHYQPFACLFWNGDEVSCLVHFLHVYINALCKSGFHVVATVCPAEHNFVKVIAELVKVKKTLKYIRKLEHQFHIFSFRQTSTILITH